MLMAARCVALLAILAGLISSAVAAQPVPAAPLTASSKWNADWAGDLCVLQRAYGQGPGALVMGFRPIPLATKVELVLISADTDKRYRFGHATVSLAPAGTQTTSDYDSYYLDKMQRRVTTLYLDLPLADVIRADLLTIAGKGVPDLRLVPGGSASAVAALAECQDDLLARWGVDPQAVRALSRQPEPAATILSAFGSNSYPEEALRAGAQGRTVARLTIGPDGRIAECKPVVRAGFDALDRRTCAIGSGLRYRPGLGAYGRPTTSWATLAVNWRLPIPG